MQALLSKSKPERTGSYRVASGSQTHALCRPPFKESLLISLLIFTLPEWKIRFKKLPKVAELMRVPAA